MKTLYPRHHRFRIFYACTLAVAALVAVSSLRAVNADDFEIYGFDFRGDGSVDLNGRLFVPPGYDPANQYPLILFFHGSGERGTDNRKQVERNINNMVSAAQARGFFIYAPQLPSGGWSSSYTENAILAVGNVMADYNIDPQRVYVTGLSLGGGGVWFSVERYAEALAAFVPVCGVSGGAADLGPFTVDEPVWAYHAANDPTVGVGQTRGRVNEILDGNGQPMLSFPLTGNDGSPYYSDGTTYYENGALRYTEYATGGHGIWNRVYNESQMYDWLLAQVNENPWDEGDTVLLDFGNRQLSGVDTQGRYWNSTPYGMHDTVGSTFVFPRLADGGRCQAVVSLDDAFGGHSQMTYAAGSLFDEEIANDVWVTENDGMGSIVFRGLLPGGEYRVRVYAYATNDDSGRGRTARYQIGSQTRDLEAANNLSDVAEFASIITDSTGRIDLKVFPSPDTTSRTAMIGAVELTLLTSPTGPINDPPEVYAGQDASVVLPKDGTVQHALSGSATDDGLPDGELTSLWTLKDGPGGVAPVIADASELSTTVTFSEAGVYTFRLTATDTATERSDEVRITVRLDGGPLGGEVVFSQDFDDSADLADYIEPTTPSIGQFDDISADGDGGTWSIVGGRFSHVRDGSTGGAGFQRFIGLGEGITFLRMEFSLSVENTTNTQDIASFLVGDWSSPIPNDSGGSNTQKAFTLTIKGRGEGTYYLRIYYDGGSTDTVDMATSSTPISVIWYANMTGEEQTYNGVDGFGHTLANNAADLWVDGSLVLHDVPRNPKHTATQIRAFRFNSESNQPVTLTFDDMMLYDQSVTLNPGTPFAQWLNGRFSAAELADADISGPDADPDGDGRVNLLEYYEDGNPKGAPNHREPPIRVLDGGGLYLKRRAVKSDLTVELWSSTNLTHWELLATSTDGAAFSSSGLVALQIIDDDGDPASVQIQDPRTDQNDAPPLFYQLRISNSL